MSFDMFLCTFRDGEPAPFSLTVLDRFLGPFIEFRSNHCWSLSFPNGGGSFLYLKDDQKEIDNFCINRPADSPELWIGLLEILRETGGMLCWPGGGRALLTKPISLICRRT